MFYSIKSSEILKIRNDIFLCNAIPYLKQNGFVKSPFLDANFGKNNRQLYIYEMCRLENSNIEFLTTYISLRDRYIQIRLNIFQLSPNFFPHFQDNF